MRDTYWHIQMFLPEGKNGVKIDSSKMLEEDQPIIGTGEWDDLQCENFKGKKDGLAIDDIIMVREGNKPLALCKIIGDYFHNDTLTDKYINYWFRPVQVLGWASPDERNSLFSQGTLKRLRKSSNTDSWNYINDWYKNIMQRKELEDYKKILKSKYQIILQGAPGTGKTYTAKDIAEQMIFDSVSSKKEDQAQRLAESDQYKLVQFHPSYTYEDFVRGIVISTEDSDSPKYLTVNKILGEFAEKALTNWIKSNKDSNTMSRYNWFSNHYNAFKENLDEELQMKRQNGEELLLKEGMAPILTAIEEKAIRCNRYDSATDSVLLKDTDIINGYIGIYCTTPSIKIKDNAQLSKSARSGMYYLYQNLIEKFKQYLTGAGLSYNEQTDTILEETKPYILIIDEINRANLPVVLGELIYALEYRGEAVNSIYKLDDKPESKKDELVLPKNLYIIGTMNTADRSVGQIDYAVRRRFAFVNMEAKDLSDSELPKGYTFESELFKQVSNLFSSENLSPEFEAKDVRLGHSYFITSKENTKEMRLEYEIKPILREYVKDGILKSEAKEKIENLAND